MVTREQPIEQGRAYTAYVKVSGWAGRETDANGCSHKIVDSKIIDLKKTTVHAILACAQLQHMLCILTRQRISVKF
jgi:hypothetical protein